MIDIPHQDSQHRAGTAIHNQVPEIPLIDSMSAEDMERNYMRHLKTDSGKNLIVPIQRSMDQEKNLHIHTTDQPRGTTGYFRLYSPLINARHALQSMIDGVSAVGVGTGITNGLAQTTLGQAVLEIIGTVDAQKFEKTITTLAKDFSPTDAAAITNHSLYEDAKLFMKRIGNNSTEIDSKLRNLIEHKHTAVSTQDFFTEQSMTANSGNMTAQWNNIQNQINDIDDPAISHQLSTKINIGYRSEAAYEKGIESAEKAALETNKELAFGDMIGIMSLMGTAHYTKRVWQDIVNTFAETVAYSQYAKGADADKIGLLDMMGSENKIVKGTMDNFIGKTAWRLGTDGIFFASSLTSMLSGNSMVSNLEDQSQLFSNAMDFMRNIPFSRYGMGIKALTLVSETQRLHTSIFDDLVELTEQKLSPQSISNPVSASDLSGLHQKYCMLYDPENQFVDARNGDSGDNPKWQVANVIFERMANLMNDTYAYKHGYEEHSETAVHDMEHKALQDKRDFAMPKFLCLLGEGLLDFNDPVKTLALVEIANNWSIQSMKQACHYLDSGQMTLPEVCTAFPVDLDRTIPNQISDQMKAISQRTREIENSIVQEFFNNHPNEKLHYERLKEKHAQPPQQASVIGESIPLPTYDDTQHTLHIPSFASGHTPASHNIMTPDSHISQFQHQETVGREAQHFASI